MKAITRMIIRYTIAQTIFFIICLPFFFLPRWFHFKFFYPLFARLYLIAPKIRVHNLSKNFIKTKKPLIVASNHKSYADFCYIAKYLRNHFSILMKKEAFDNNIFFKIIGWKMALIPIDRKDAVSQKNAMERAKNIIIKKNYSLIMFPEGWYHYEVPVGTLKNGIAKLAEETNASVLPAAIYGISHKFLEEKKLRWKDVYLKFGKPIKYSDYNDREKFLQALKIKIEKLYFEILDDLNLKN